MESTKCWQVKPKWHGCMLCYAIPYHNMQCYASATPMQTESIATPMQTESNAIYNQHAPDARWEKLVTCVNRWCCEVHIQWKKPGTLRYTLVNYRNRCLCDRPYSESKKETNEMNETKERKKKEKVMLSRVELS